MIQKKYIKTRNACKLTFILPQTEIPDEIEVESLAVVGNFNEWDATALPMEPSKKGVYRAQVEVKPGQELQFRYLANGEHWFNAWEADAYAPSGLGVDNCVLFLPAPGK